MASHTLVRFSRASTIGAFAAALLALAAGCGDRPDAHSAEVTAAGLIARAVGLPPGPYPVDPSALPDRAWADGKDAIWQALADNRRQAHAGRGAPARPEPDLFCDRMGSGRPGTRDPRIDLSAAHALVRAFGVDSSFAPSDAALATALSGDDPFADDSRPATLGRYAAALTDVCALHADPAPLPPATVQRFARLALVRPGTGSIQLPPGTEVLVVDLTGLPEADGLQSILHGIAAQAMTTPVPQSARIVRTHAGPVDEVFSPANVYSTSLGFAQPPPIPASGARDLPIVLVAGPRIAPQAAYFAASMRAAGRAFIAGSEVSVAVAESEWRGVGARGVGVRTSMMGSVERLPPEVYPDQIAVQADPLFDFSTAYRKELTVAPGTVELDVTIDGPEGTDLDLLLLQDLDGNGVFELFDELIAYSGELGSRERITLPAPSPGAYQALVWGYDVPGGTAPFTLEIRRASFAPLPDVLEADFPNHRVTPADLALYAQQTIGRAPPAVAGPASRSAPAQVYPFGYEHPEGQSRGELRAALIAAHGGLRLFFPYFPLVGDGIDERLLETLEAAERHDESDRIAAWRTLRRFGEVIHDGHQFVFSLTPLYATALPVFLEDVVDRPTVRRSAAPDIHPGDAIVALGGRPIAEVYAEELSRTSAATRGYQLDIANRYIYQTDGPLTLELEDTSGARRTVTVEPQPREDYLDVIFRVASDRPSGPLADLGAPGLYYLNLNRVPTMSIEAVWAALEAASGSAGLVLDMRGYPGVDHYEVAQRLIRQPFLSPIFNVRQYGADGSSVGSSQYVLPPLGPPAFAGPIVLLTGPHAVSAAENFMQMLVGADRLLAIVGQRSAGTNGNITGLSLPGGFLFTYTGMEVLNPDGTTHHGVGIVPDVEVPLTADDLRDGIDRDLLTAISLLPH